MIVTVGGELVGLGALVRRGPMNFGDDVPGWTVLQYRLHIPVGHLVTTFEPTYEQFAREALDDARQFPEDWPELAPAIAAGMPPLAALPATLPAYLTEVLREHLAMDLLDAVLPLPDVGAAPFLANTVDDVTVDPTAVTVNGCALQVPGRGPR